MERLRNWRLWLCVALFLFGAWRYFAAVDVYGRQGGGVKLDGFYYYIYLHSLAGDGDLDLTNDYQFQGYDVAYKPTWTGRPANPFSIGPALLWAPFLLLAHLLALIRSWLGEPGLSLNVMSEFHQNVTLFGSYLYGCGAIYVCYRLLARLFPPAVAFWSALGVGLGGPLVYYMIASPSYSHAQSALVFSLLVWAWLSWREAMTLRRWALLGLLAGLTALVHPGNVLLALLPAGTGVAAVYRAARAPEGRARALALALAGPLLAAVVAAAVFSPQLLAWKAIYGKSLLTPQGKGFMRFSESMWHATLFSPRNGLLTLTPIFGLSLLGLLGMLRRRPAVAGAALGALALLAFVNGAVYDWWGWGFGARRYTVALPLFGLGLAALVDGLRRWLLAHREGVARALAPLAIGLLVLMNVQLFREFRKDKLDGASQVPTQETYRISFAGFLRDLVTSVGNPLSFPANWLFALRHGVEVERYDKIHGFHFLDDNHVGANPHPPKLHDSLDFTRVWPARFLGRGWGEVVGVSGSGGMRPVTEERASILLPLNVHNDVTLSFMVRPQWPGTRLRVLLDGQQVVQQTLTAGWQEAGARVARKLIRRGVNHLELQHTPPPGSTRACPLTIGRTGVRSPVAIAAVGADHQHGNFADIWVDGRRACANRRGLNLTAVDPGTGQVLRVAGFDLHRNRSASVAMLKFVRHLPQGTIVALASRDEASRRFTSHAREALRMLGLTSDLTDRYRHPLAAVGLRGAKPGAALEQLLPSGRAHACVGRVPPPWRSLAWYEVLRLKLHE